MENDLTSSICPPHEAFYIEDMLFAPPLGSVLRRMSI
jgi:hypothetical protein